MANKGAWVTLALYIFALYFFEPLVQEIKAILGDQTINYITTIIITAMVTSSFFLVIMKKRETFEVYSWLLIVAITIMYIISNVDASGMLHLSVFAVMACLAFYAFKKSQISSPHIKSFLLVAAAGIIDETIHLLIPGRHFDIFDVELDLVSAALMLIIFSVIFREKLNADNLTIVLATALFAWTFFNKNFAGYTAITIFMILALMITERFDMKIRTLMQGKITFFLGVLMTIIVLSYDLIKRTSISIGMLQIIALIVCIITIAKGLEAIKSKQKIEIP